MPEKTIDNNLIEELQISNFTSSSTIQEFLNLPSSSIVKDTISTLANANTLGEMPSSREKTRSKIYFAA